MLLPFVIRYGGAVYHLVEAAGSGSGAEDKEFKSLFSRVQRSFRTLIDSGSVAAELQRAAVEQFPEDLEQAKGYWIKQVVVDPKVNSFLTVFSTDSVKPAFFLTQMKKVLFDGVDPAEVSVVIQKKLWEDHVRRSTEVQREVYLAFGIPKEIVDRFLPKILFVEVDPSGNIIQEFEKYGAVAKTINSKRNSMLILIKHWNKLVKTLKRDLASPDPVLRLKALIASIILHTGIRVGAGESYLKDDDGVTVKDAEGNPVKIETAGATSLKRDHITFIRDGFVRIEFLGKAAHRNIVELTDPEIISVLEQHLTDTENNVDGYAFATRDGRRITAKAINRYLHTIVGPDVSAHNLRHLYGTKTFFTTLRRRQRGLAKRLRQLKTETRKELADQAVAQIVDFLMEVATDTQLRLHHKDLADTIRYYVNPRIVLEFLNNAGLYRSLDAVLGDGKGLSLKFDVFEFYATMMKQYPEAVTAMMRIAKTMFYVGERFVDYDVDELIAKLED